MKKIIVGTAVVVIAVVAILALLPFAIDLNKHKEAILGRMKTYTTRQVDFSEIRLTILTGLGAEIKDLRISDDMAFSKEDFLTLKAARISVELLPLLSRQIKISAVVLREPKIHVVKNPAGVFNFATLVIPRPGEKHRKPKTGALASLLVSDVVIKQGTVTYVDQKQGPNAKPFMISDIELESRDISPYRPVDFSLSASVMTTESQNMALAGTVGPVPASGEFSMIPLNVHLILDSFPLSSLGDKVPFKSGNLRLDITASGTLKDKITSKLALNMDGLAFGAAEKQPPGRSKGLSCMIANDMTLDISRQQLTISNGTFSLGQDTGTFHGTINQFKSSPAWDIQIRSDSIKPGPILEQMPMFAGLIPSRITLSGPAGFSINTSGTKASYQLNTAIDMSPMAVTFGKTLNKPSGTPMKFSSVLTMQPGITRISKFDLGLGAIASEGTGESRKTDSRSLYQIKIHTKPFSMQEAQAIIPVLQSFKPSGNMVMNAVINGASGMPMNISMQASSERMGLVLAKPKDGQQPKSKVLSGPMKADMHTVSLALDAIKKDKALSARGSLKSRGGVFMEVPYASLAGTFSLENDEFNLNSLDINALKGSIRGSATYNIKTKSWSAAPVFSNVNAGSILDALTNFKGVFTGSITGDLKAKGVAGAPALDNLDAQGNLTISKGEWKNFDLAGTALSSILGMPGASEIFGFAPQEVQRYNATRFESLSTSIDLAKKMVHVDNMKLLNISSGKDLDTESNLKGTISMETSEVHLKGDVVLPKRLSQRIGARSEAFSSIMNDQKRLVLPITITGSVKKPFPMVELKSLSSAFTRHYANKALEKGLKKLQDKGTLPQGTDETRKPLDTLMDGLFKKKKK